MVSPGCHRELWLSGRKGYGLEHVTQARQASFSRRQMRLGLRVLRLSRSPRNFHLFREETLKTEVWIIPPQAVESIGAALATFCSRTQSSEGWSAYKYNSS